MLTLEGCRTRRQRLWDSLPSACDFLVLADPSHLIYFANYAQSPFVFRSNDGGAILILEREKTTLVADNLARPFCDRSFVDLVIAPVWYQGKQSAIRRRELLARSACDAVSRISGHSIGLDLDSVPAAIIEGIRSARGEITLVDLGPTIRQLRRAKDPDEMAVMRRAITAVSAAADAGRIGIAPGMSEFEAFLFLQSTAQEVVGDQAVVYGDFVSGPRCATDRGGPPSARRIETGDLVLLDFSVVVHGYRGDIASTFAVGGSPTPRQSELAAICLEALAACEALLRPGTPGREIDATARRVYARHGVAEFNSSHTGHGLGLGHPDPPYLVPESDDTLAQGDVVAVEPGLYVPGVGGMRFEHNYAITASGCERLSQHVLGL